MCICLFQNSYTLLLVQLLAFLIAVTHAYPSISIRESFNKHSKDMRVGQCIFDDELHINCNVCARMYSSLTLYTDCCYSIDDPVAQWCANQRWPIITTVFWTTAAIGCFAIIHLTTWLVLDQSKVFLLRKLSALIVWMCSDKRTYGHTKVLWISM